LPKVENIDQDGPTVREVTARINNKTVSESSNGPDESRNQSKRTADE